MAKRKKKRTEKREAQIFYDAAARESARQAGQESNLAEDDQKKAASAQPANAAKSMPASAAAPPGKQPRGTVSIATCCAGMFLALVLGIYLGTLMPSLMQKTAQTQRQAQTPVPPPVGESMDPQLARAIAEQEKRAAANPASAVEWINLGNVYFDAHKPPEAIKAYEHALSLAPDNADVLTDLGIMYREIGDFERAVASFRKAIAINPGHQNAMFNEGVVLAHDLNRKEDAVNAWQRLLDINPGAHSPSGKPLKDMIRQLRQ